MRTKISGARVISLYCRSCKVHLPNRVDIGLAIIDAVEHSVRGHVNQAHTVRCTFVGLRNNKGVKHTIAV